MKKTVALLLVVCQILTMFGGMAMAESTYTPGAYTVTAKGFNGDVVVTVEVDPNAICAVTVDANSETQGIGTKAIESMPAEFVAKNSAEIDTVAGATITSNALKLAVSQALKQAAGMAEAEIALVDGAYTATASSYGGQVTLTVNVANNQITGIAVDNCTDTYGIGTEAFDLLIEDVLAAQSLNVDSISGATVSTNGFVAAAADALNQAAAGAGDAWKTRAVEKRAAETVVYDTDILVIGAGIAGLSAAVEAANQGANVILMEKLDVLGNSTTRSEGLLQAAGTSVQRDFGVEDSTEAMFADIYSLYKAEEKLDKTLLHIAVDQGDELVDFLRNEGVVFNNVYAISTYAPRNVPRTHVTQNRGSGITCVLRDSAERNGVKVLMGTPATELIKKDGAVVGAKGTNAYGDDVTVNASAVILCAGSYTANAELFKELNPKIQPERISGCGDGDGYYLAKNAGADMINLDYPQLLYQFYSNEMISFPKVSPGSAVRPAPELLQMNAEGVRIENEELFCFDFVQKVWESGHNEAWALAGKDFAERYPETMEQVVTLNLTSRDVPLGYTADTVEELAVQAGLDPQVLCATFERYNQMCEQGFDEDFGKNPKYLEKLEAPFYLIRIPQCVTDGYSGARINEHAQVIDTEGQIIPGLYAAGSCAVAQMSSVRYYGCGTSLLICGVYGRLAADHAVSLLK